MQQSLLLWVLLCFLGFLSRPVACSQHEASLEQGLCIWPHSVSLTTLYILSHIRLRTNLHTGLSSHACVHTLFYKPVCFVYSFLPPCLHSCDVHACSAIVSTFFSEALSRVFADRGCERIGRLRLVVDTVQLEAQDLG